MTERELYRETVARIFALALEEAELTLKRLGASESQITRALEEGTEFALLHRDGS